MGSLEGDKPAVMAMVALQVCYAGSSLSTRAALLHGMSPMVFIVYRQAIATFAISPFAYYSRRKSVSRCSLDLRSFGWIFLVSLLGITINQNLSFEGLYLVSSSIASAMTNIVPAVTFFMASLVGYEKVNLRNIRSVAMVTGTTLCVAGAVSMSMFRGPKILNLESELRITESVFGSSDSHNLWLLGCLCLFGSTCCWSLWLILQVRVSAVYPDHLSLSAWMCFFGTLQSSAFAFFIERDPNNWILHSYVELASCLYSGIVASGLAFFAQSWVVSKRGPLFSAMFSPLNTVVVTVFAFFFLNEEIYIGSLTGGLGVIIGLYTLLWGKAKDNEQAVEDQNDEYQSEDQTFNLRIQIESSYDNQSSKMDLQEPLLSNDKSIAAEEIRTQQQP